jgi:hypothetical protein
VLWVALAAAQPVGAPPPKGLVVDRVVALLDGTLISQLDLEFETSVLLIQRGTLAAATEALDERVLGRALEVLLAQRLVTREADKLQAFPLEEGELEAKLKAFEARFESHEAFERFLRRFEADRAMLGEVIRRGVRYERILDNKVRLRAQVSEDELRRYYEAHSAQLQGSYEAVRPALREKLTTERYARLVLAEVQQLRGKADIRRVGP